MLENQVSFMPCGVTARFYAPVPTAQCIEILQNPKTYDSLISDMIRGGVVHFEPVPAFSDPLVSQIVSTIGNEMEGGFRDHMLVDALNTALAARIVRRFVDSSKIMLEPSNELSRGTVATRMRLRRGPSR